MTLEEKAEEWLKNNLHSTEEDYKKAYLSGAEEVKADCDFALEGKDVEINELKAENELIKNSDSLCKLIGEQKLQIEKMKCCENCKYNSYWGNELHCNYGLKKALQEDKLVECHNLDKWELKE